MAITKRCHANFVFEDLTMCVIGNKDIDLSLKKEFVDEIKKYANQD